MKKQILVGFWIQMLRPEPGLTSKYGSATLIPVSHFSITIRSSLKLWWRSSFEHEPIIYGLQAVGGFLFDEYLSKSDDLRYNFNKIGQYSYTE